MRHSATPNTSENRSFSIAETVVEPLLNQLTRDGQKIHVERRVMLLLLFLVENVDQAVTRDSLLTQLWVGSTPTDEALTQAVSKLRKALGDNPHDAQVIQTIRKVGYRLKGPVSYIDDRPTDSSRRPRRASLWQSGIRWTSAAAVIVILLGFATILDIVTIRVVEPEVTTHENGPHMMRVMIARLAEPEVEDSDVISKEEAQSEDEIVMTNDRERSEP